MSAEYASAHDRHGLDGSCHECAEQPAECVTALMEELAQAVHQDEISECVWQVLICAYLDHEGWRRAAEIVFAVHGYTPEEIRLHNEGGTA